MHKRLAVARIWLEVNSFSPLPSVLSDFENSEWARGPAVLDRFRGTPTELGAVAAFADANPGWQVEVLRCAAAQPGGHMDDALFDAFLDELRADLGAGPWDAVYLSLHGALATERRRTPDLDVLRLAREMAGTVPIGVSFDMHANMAPEIARIADVAAGYKTLPHIDMFEVGAKVLDMLAATVEGRIRPTGIILRAGRIIHSHNMRTADGPMKDLEAIARDLTRGPILDVTPFGGFPWADTPNTGASVMVYADGDAAAARAAAETMADAIRRKAPEFAVVRPEADEGLRQALALGDGPGPVAVVEASDNIYSGGIADTPGLLRALLDLAPAVPTVFAFFFDAGMVARAHAAGVGGRVAGHLGGRVTADFGPPVAIDAEVVRLTDGSFINHGPMLRGVETRLGRTAVLRIGQVDVIVTERREPVNDLAYMELHGIDIARTRLLCIKAKNHFRAAYGPVCRAFIEVDTPGPAGVDLARLPFRFAPVEEYA
ncbi:microcystin degradation protein MlrC [Stella humosa]|uniref:Microcystinase C n=1 Tax=Stella humosa TaxID=94 RepID=A0A3N1L207_9PROT|nr:M81 family metallopeptidase [Stella humosa]ROP84496.1 microcystin degradation protein MlrC [Stella humosa]BBK34016.1 microcystinase C [Stella humosa]